MSSAQMEAMEEGRQERGGKYLTFFLGEEEYGIEILKVREIIGMMEITPVPSTPSYVRGVINLRGKVIPVICLRRKFGMEAVEPTEESCIIVVEAEGRERGIIVDKVSEVQDIDGADIEPPPAFEGTEEGGYILGIGKTEGEVKLLLDIDATLKEKGIVEMKIADAV